MCHVESMLTIIYTLFRVSLRRRIGNQVQILNGPTAVSSCGNCIEPLSNWEGAETGQNYKSEDLPEKEIKRNDGKVSVCWV
jgi:hypothetical protein